MLGGKIATTTAAPLSSSSSSLSSSLPSPPPSSLPWPCSFSFRRRRRRSIVVFLFALVGIIITTVIFWQPESFSSPSPCSSWLAGDVFVRKSTKPKVEVKRESATITTTTTTTKQRQHSLIQQSQTTTLSTSSSPSKVTQTTNMTATNTATTTATVTNTTTNEEEEKKKKDEEEEDVEGSSTTLPTTSDSSSNNSSSSSSSNTPTPTTIKAAAAATTDTTNNATGDKNNNNNNDNNQNDKDDDDVDDSAENYGNGDDDMFNFAKDPYDYTHFNSSISINSSSNISKNNSSTIMNNLRFSTMARIASRNRAHALRIPYQCHGPRYHAFAQALRDFAVQRIMEASDQQQQQQQQSPASSITPTSSTSTMSSLWGQRELPPNTRILLWGNSHTRQVALSLVGQHAATVTVSSAKERYNTTAAVAIVEKILIYDAQYNKNMARRFDLGMGRSVYVVANSYVAYADNWQQLLEQQIRKKFRKLDAVVFGTLNSCQAPVPTTFATDMKAFSQSVVGQMAGVDCETREGPTFDQVADAYGQSRATILYPATDVADHVAPVAYVSMFAAYRKKDVRAARDLVHGMMQKERETNGTRYYEYIDARSYINEMAYNNNDNRQRQRRQLASNNGNDDGRNDDYSSEDDDDNDIELAMQRDQENNDSNDSNDNDDSNSDRHWECGSKARDGVSDCINDAEAERYFHRCVGPAGGHADLIAWDIIEFVWKSQEARAKQQQEAQQQA